CHMEQHRVNVDVSLQVDPCHITKDTNTDIPYLESNALPSILAPVEQQAPSLHHRIVSVKHGSEASPQDGMLELCLLKQSIRKSRIVAWGMEGFIRKLTARMEHLVKKQTNGTEHKC